MAVFALILWAGTANPAADLYSNFMFVQAFSSGFIAITLSSSVKAHVLNFTTSAEEIIWCKLPLGNYHFLLYLKRP